MPEAQIDGFEFEGLIDLTNWRSSVPTMPTPMRYRMALRTSRVDILTGNIV
jgi:hypothetical protein